MQYERIANGVTERFEGTLEEITALMIRIPARKQGVWKSNKVACQSKYDRDRILEMMSKY